MSRPSGQAHFDLGLAALTSLGGVFGYMKARSLPSLIGGLGFGALFAGSGYLIDNVSGFTGHTLGGVSSLLLTTVMGMRFARTRKVMPAGILSGAGLVGMFYHFQKMREWAP